MRLFVGVSLPEELRKCCALLQKELPRQLRLVSLSEDVQKKLADFRKEDHQSIVPHLTIARVSEKVKLDIDKWKDASFGEFLVSSFVLYESVLTSQGSMYRIVKEFGLRL